MQFSIFPAAAIFQYWMFAQVNGAALPTTSSDFDFAGLTASGFPSGVPSGFPSSVPSLPQGGKGNSTHGFPGGPGGPGSKGNGTYPHGKGNGTHPKGKSGPKNNDNANVPFLSKFPPKVSASAELTSLTFAAGSATATA